MKKLLPLLLLSAVVVSAQEAKKPLSPPAKTVATIGGKKITIDYSAPSKRGRAIMGGLVPFDQVWRTGANAAATLVTEGDIMLGTVHVPAGTYTLYTLPGAKAWTLIVNKQTGQWGTNYDESQDLGRVKMTLAKTDAPVETFVIGIESKSPKSGLLTLTWENTQASVPIISH
ncbi:MAG TPA: DUF2911 domain-containing protein [Thermoanaerobaculia bacterium]|nr:DUF2911 domain-containing protein [Thermoanaerobaculia bacterium]